MLIFFQTTIIMFSDNIYITYKKISYHKGKQKTNEHSFGHRGVAFYK